ncbi:MAG: hypothetical protein ACLR1A_07530 [Eubacterium ventriosum]
MLKKWKYSIQRLEDLETIKKQRHLEKSPPEIKGKYSFGNLNNVCLNMFVNP